LKILGTGVKAMTVRVTGREFQPVRQPLGQRRLQAVVIRTGFIIYEVNNPQEREVAETGGDAGAGGVAVIRTDARAGVRDKKSLIDVAHSLQVSAVIADVANLQRKVAGEAMLDIDVVIDHIWSLQVRIDRIEAAL
jgi:hypothetical protein